MFVSGVKRVAGTAHYKSRGLSEDHQLSKHEQLAKRVNYGVQDLIESDSDSDIGPGPGQYSQPSTF